MLRFETITMPAADLNGESSIPLLSSFFDRVKPPETKLDDDDGLYIGYGFVNSAFPYRSLDRYTRELKPREFPCAVLENKYLKATFLTSLGGRLWSLIDKTKNRELLFSNPVLRFGYLATRNAWFSGGIEWNCGVWGHHPLTCEPLFTAVLKDTAGNTVLRMYEYERIRSVVFQMDFSLPENSPFLRCRMRIENFDKETKPIYWWSNIAVPEIKDARVIAPADETYTHEGTVFTKLSLPLRDGVDITYPTNQIVSHDNFWKTKTGKRKYICQLDQTGYGLVQTSTSRLKGRKLFVWGQKAGGARWQEYLSGNGCAGRYCEIQAGLAATQHESLPMPPNTAWEWMEFYGPLQADPVKIHGTWQDAQTEVEASLEQILPEAETELLLAETKKTALTRADKVISKGSGWGALENERRKKAGQNLMPQHLDFTVPTGKTGPQRQWFSLLENGCLPELSTSAAPPSWMLQKEWIELMELAAVNQKAENWYLYLQLGVSYYAKQRYREAREALQHSISLHESAWGLYALGELNKQQGDLEQYASLLHKAALISNRGNNWDVPLVKRAAAALYETEKFEELYTFIHSLPEEIQRIPRLMLYCAFAAVHIGRYQEAERLLSGDQYQKEEGELSGDLVVPDIKEGEISMSELWYLIQEAKAASNGQSFDRESAVVPKIFDFRMK